MSQTDKYNTGPAPVEVQEKPKQREMMQKKIEGLIAFNEQSRCSNAKNKFKQLPKLKNLRLRPKGQVKCRTGQIRTKKNSNDEDEGKQSPLIRQGHSYKWRSALRSPSGIEEKCALMKTAPQEMEERIGELIYKEKVDGMGGKTKRFIQAWKQIGKEDFINTGFYLRFKDQNSQQRLEENKIIIPFRGTQEEKKAYQEMLKEQLEEEQVMSIQYDQIKRRNHTFQIKKRFETCRKILDPSKLNKEIVKLHFKLHELEDVQYIAKITDYATSLDLKSAHQHTTESPNSIPYLAFNFNNNNYAYKAMPFGTKHSPIFFAKAIESILRQIRLHSEIIILNYCDDIPLIHQDKQTLKTQTLEIMKTLEQNEYKNVGREKVKDDISIKGLVKHNIQEQKRENKTTSSADRQIELSETPDKRSVSVSNRIGQSEDTSIKDGIMGWDNDSKQCNNQGIEMVDKENRGQPTRIVDQQNNNMHVNNRCITAGLESEAEIRERDE
ncbi:MAG: hypothetical protein EZS28_039695, partial [Streblomastix strix]